MIKTKDLRKLYTTEEVETTALNNVNVEVKAGEFIQIIDVQGRQCSDLQAFPVRALDKGIERCLDVTVTRTLMGQGYPGPGLMAKYYDQDFQPLVEIVQEATDLRSRLAVHTGQGRPTNWATFSLRQVSGSWVAE